MRSWRVALAGVGLVPLLGALAGCQPVSVSPARLPPTLSFQRSGAGEIAYQDGMPVPAYGFQPARTGLALDAGWRFQPAYLSQVLTFQSRQRSLRAIERSAGGRQRATYDTSAWSPVAVPGTFSPPPASGIHSGWYRDSFLPPPGWKGKDVVLKFASVNYLADIWLNGSYLGYHEGGYTPFAFDIGSKLHYGSPNTLAVRVDAPPPGTRLDIVPWGLADWWEYGGITGPVWLEAADRLSVVRADVVPHLDAADITVVVRNHSTQPVQNGSLKAEILPAQVTAANLLNPDPTSLVPAGSAPIAARTIRSIDLGPQAVAAYDITFVLAGAYHWTPGLPALYVLSVQLQGSSPAAVSRNSSPSLSPPPSSPAAPSPGAGGSAGARATPGTPALVSHRDTFYTTFGLRTIAVDPTRPRLLLNGVPTGLVGVSVQDERIWPPRRGPDSVRGGPHPSLADWLRVLNEARSVHADLLRTGHTPASPELLMLADRMGFAIWEEIPLTHNTPQTLTLAMGRGIPQQMLAEMDLRDFNHPSVLFHGFANESNGISVRTEAMKTLNDLDHRIDGTRLSGQAMYGSDPSDPTSAPLDVAAYTFYYGVFYGGVGIEGATLKALTTAHATYPHKPIVILEFGYWADDAAGAQQQVVVFEQTYRALHARWTNRPHGYVAAAVWWTLNDYWTGLPGIGVEHFGVFRSDGAPRPVAASMATSYGRVAQISGAGVDQSILSGGQGAAPEPPSLGLLGLFIGYALGFGAATTLLIGLVVTWLRRHRGPPRIHLQEQRR